MSNPNTDTEFTPTAIDTDAEAVDVKAPKKVPPRVIEVKPAWEPSNQVTAAMDAIAAIDHTDKKGIARIVKAAIDLRTGAKSTRDRAEVASDES